jgi:hypothetical protein
MSDADKIVDAIHVLGVQILLVPWLCAILGFVVARLVQRYPGNK